MESTKEEQNNIRLYPIYKMLSWDLLFYYSIIFLFLTQVKGISAADVLLAESAYPIFKFILLIPLTALITKIGKRNSLIMANGINAISIFCYIVAQNFTYILIGQFLSAIAFVIKGVAETNLLYDNLPKDEKRGAKFSKIDGQGLSWYYYADAIASILSGFLYIINGYFPLILCLICCIISTFLAFKFKRTGKKETVEEIHFKTYIKDLKHSFKYMLQSNRLKYLLLFGAIFSGLLSVLITLRSGILEQMGVSEQYFGVIFAIFGIISGISAKNQDKVHNRYRNKTLGVLAVPTTISCIVTGFMVLGKFSFQVTLILVLTMFFIQYVARGPFYTLIRRYLNNFTTSSLRNKITSSYNLVESVARAMIGLFASWLLRITQASNAVMVIGCIATIAVVLLLDKMSSKVGLKPEEYEKREIEFLEIK
ncbi:MAG: MFS transporter [Clostridia bacterium]|nr:MFS transporter [Clostridia bacterium]